MHKIEEAFDDRFEQWRITFPEDDLHQRRKGSLQMNGWTINYYFGAEDGREYLEYYASHRMTNDTLNKISQMEPQN